MVEDALKTAEILIEEYRTENEELKHKNIFLEQRLMHLQN